MKTYYSLVAQRVKHLPAMWETRVRSLGREDPLEKEMATHSSILAWRIPWTEEPGGLQSTGSHRVDTTERLHFHFHFHYSLLGFPGSAVVKARLPLPEAQETQARSLGREDPLEKEMATHFSFLAWRIP